MFQARLRPELPRVARVNAVLMQKVERASGETILRLLPGVGPLVWITYALAQSMITHGMLTSTRKGVEVSSALL